MNYMRIYDAFIADRRGREAGITGYFEVHHIVPRCLGGGNESRNLIRLSAEDHFFAHLLLAQIHGGKLWHAVFLMSGKMKKIDALTRRRTYAIARKRFAEVERGKDGLKGSDNGNYRADKISWRHCDTGEIRVATLHEMWTEFGGNRGMWTSCYNGNKRSALGWTVGDREVNRSYKGRQFEFENRDGRVFCGTQKEFANTFGISAASTSRVCRHGDVTTCGWRKKGVADRSHHSAKATGVSPRRDSGCYYRLSKDGVVHVAKRQGAAKFVNSAPSSFSACFYATWNGEYGRHKGWRIEKVAA